MIAAIRIDLDTEAGALLEVAAVTRSGPGQVQQATLSEGRAEQLVRTVLEFLDQKPPDLKPPRVRVYHDPREKGGAA